jgi:hypothetical protein
VSGKSRKAQEPVRCLPQQIWQGALPPRRSTKKKTEHTSLLFADRRKKTDDVAHFLADSHTPVLGWLWVAAAAATQSQPRKEPQDVQRKEPSNCAFSPQSGCFASAVRPQVRQGEIREENVRYLHQRHRNRRRNAGNNGLRAHTARGHPDRQEALTVLARSTQDHLCSLHRRRNRRLIARTGCRRNGGIRFIDSTFEAPAESAQVSVGCRSGGPAVNDFLNFLRQV